MLVIEAKFDAANAVAREIRMPMCLGNGSP